MSRIKKIRIAVLAIVGLLLLFGIWYQYRYSMDKAETFQVNSSVDTSNTLLIATQGSDFKNSITQHIVNHFKAKAIFINVIDISELEIIEPTDYNAMLIIHTWENWKPPISVEHFINKSKAYKDRIVVITTSGEGSYKMTEVDAITGESKTENIIPITKLAINKLELILN